MKFPYSMLRDFVDTSLDAEAVGDLLTMAGFELEGIEVVEGEPVLDVKVMSNRGDGLSVFGLSREVLAKDAGARPTELFKSASDRFPAPALPSFEGLVQIETEDCTRYACLVIEDVVNTAAPDWVQERLRRSGQRPISLLVDLTNYVMLELGQPLHAFDLDKLAKPSPQFAPLTGLLPGAGEGETVIVVRKARDGEKLTTLDGNEHELGSDQMMICDTEKPVAAAGIMGGFETEVDAATTRVLLESAHFVNTSVRRTRKQLGLSTEASYRFERSVDPGGVVAALARFAELLAAADGGRSKVTASCDPYPEQYQRQAIELSVERASLLLGMSITTTEAAGYLDKLGFRIGELAGDGQAKVMVTPPTWRPDVLREEDLIEELGRVHGYERIPESLPVGTTIIGGSSGFEAWCDQLRNVCLRAGFDQTISYSLRDKSALDEPGRDSVEVRNPNSPEMAWLRSSLLPSLADNAKRNGSKDLRLFEQGRVFSVGEGNQYREEVQLAFLSQGLLSWADWVDKQPSAASFFTLKGVVEDLLLVAGVDAMFVDGDDPRLHPTMQASVVPSSANLGQISQVDLIGRVGRIDPDVAESTGLSADTVLAELRLEAMYERHHAAPRLRPISRNPSVRRDIALLIDKSVPYSKIEGALDSVIGDLLEKRWLFDVYEGKGIPEGKHSLAIALQLRKAGENFTDEEANQVREKAVAALASLGGIPR